MRYRQWEPDPALAQFVDCWWALEGAGGGELQAVLPDGTTELIFHFHDPFDQLLDDGRRVRQPESLMAGQLSRSLLLHPGSSVCTVGVRLKPAAGRAIAGVALHELTNRPTDLRDLNARLARDAAAASAASSLEAFVAALQSALLSAVEGRAIDPATARAVHAVERSGGCASIDRVCEEAGIRARDLERRFARDVGLTPKGFSRIVRFQRAVRALESGQPNLIDAALSAGYYDQPHFTREFTAIARTPPTRWLSGEHELARYFTTTNRERVRR